MEVTDGNLSWAATLDISQIKSARTALEDYFQQIGMSAEEAGKAADDAMKTISDSVAEAMKDVRNEAEALDVLKTAYAEMAEQLATMDDGEAKEVLQGVVDGFENVINEMEETIAKNGELGNSFGSVSDIMVKLLGGTENYNKIISNLPAPLQSAISGIQGMATAAKAFVATPLGATIAAIVLALQAMRTWLNSSVEGQMRLAEITGYLKGILGQLKEVVIEVGKWLYKAFTDPKKAIEEFWEAVKNNVVNRLKAVGDIAAAVGKILKSAFTLDFDGVKEAVKELGESFLQLGTGIDDLPSKIKNKIGQIGDAAKEQAAINRERKELEIEESKWAIRRAELQNLMNEAQAGFYKGSKADREKALDDYKRYNEEILKAEEGFIDKKISLQEREMALTTNGIEDENTLRDLQAQKIQKQAESAQRLAMLQRRENAVDNLGKSDEKSRIKAEERVAKELTELKMRNAQQNLELMRDSYAKEVAAATVAYEEELTKISLIEEKWKKAQSGILTGEQSDELDNARRLSAEKMQKANADALKNMLYDYRTYEQKVADMEREYANLVGAIRAEAYKVDEQGNFLHTEEEILAYEEAIANAVNEQVAAQQELEVEYGKTSKLAKQINSLENEKSIAVDKGDTEEVKRLNEEIRKLKKQLDDLEKTSNKKAVGTMFKEWAQELKASDLISAGGELANVIANIGEAAGSEAIADLGQALSFAGDVGAKIASGDYLGAVLTVLTDIGDTIASDIAKTKEFENEMRQAAVDADLLRIAEMMDAGDTIFGEDALAQLNDYNEALDAAKGKLDELKREAETTAHVESIYSSNNFAQYLMQGKVFKTKNYSGLANSFGVADEFDTLQEFAKRNNMELYDEYGKFNRNVLELFKNTYSDLSDEDKQWIDNAIAYTDEYARAMEGLSSYLEGLFGNVADTIADQFIDSFIKSGQAAMEFENVVADVARNMVKNLIKSMILEDVMKDYSESFKRIMTSGEYSDEEARTAALLQLFLSMGSEIEGLQPAVQALLEAYQQYIGDLDGATASMSGNLLQSASQDSVDLLNGQLNAVRTNQALMVGRVDSIILQLSGIYDEVRDFHDDSNTKLNQLIDNTSERGSIARAFGLA